MLEKSFNVIYKLQFRIMTKCEPKRLNRHTFLFQVIVHAFTLTLQQHQVCAFAANLYIRGYYLNIISGFMVVTVMAVW